MEEKQYKISVIIPIYNVEKYIEETINSVISQSIGFEKNVQLVLMNDGSKDNSEEICLRYQNKYPNNIVYVKQENAGVSNARNNAMPYAKGELVTFLDSDDKWSKDSFEIAYRFWKKHNDIKVISCKMVFFDGKVGNHPLNYKYNMDRVIDVTKDYKYAQLSSSSVFIERETLLNYRYDPTVKYSEDNKLINEIILDNPKIGILKKPIYYYRRRLNLSSAIQGSTKNKDWYLKTPKDVYEYLFDLSVKKYGKVLDYIKFLVAYDIGWRISVNDFEDVLTVEEQKEYLDTIYRLIKEIDIHLIVAQKHIKPAQKLYMLSIQEGKSMSDCMSYSGNVMTAKGFDKANHIIPFITLDNVYVRDNKLYIYGSLNEVLCNKEKLKLYANNKIVKIEFYELKNPLNEQGLRKEYIIKNIGFKCVIDLINTKTFEFRYENKTLANIEFGKRAKFNNELKGSYFVVNKKIITYDAGLVNISKSTFIKRLNREVKNVISLIKCRKLLHLIIRMSIIFTRPFYSKNIWIVSDRINMAKDSGEQFFKYLNSNKLKRVNSYFAISKKSADYERMKKYGKVVDVNSIRYKLLFVHSKYIISTHAEDYITNIFGRSNKYFYDLLKFRYIFLQHGVTQNDLSAWLNPNDKAIDKFITSAKPEYESVLKFGYDKNIVALTGMARFDNLVKNTNSKKQILIQPTWRKYLAGEINKQTGRREYNPEFKKSEFYTFYNGLVNNKELIDFLKEKGYKMKLCVHPNMIAQLKDFESNEVLEVEKGETDYQKEFIDTAMLITDYSSVFFDMAYLKKPVIYTQFDKERFYEGQIYQKGYFEFKRDGFGPICEDVEATVKTIKEIISKDCKMDKQYLDRVKKFYYKMDDKNSERIYNEIIKIK